MSGVRAHFVAHTRAVPACDPLDAFAAADGDRFYWERPDEGLAIAATGARHVIEANGPERFAEVNREVERLFKATRRTGVGPPEASPFVVGGFAFADCNPRDPDWEGFPASRMVLPQRLVVRRGGRCWATDVEGGEIDATGTKPPTLPAAARGLLRGAERPDFRLRADRPGADFESLVARALESIRQGELEKVVLARSVRIGSEQSFSVPRILAALRERNPSCATFAVGRGPRTWLGATPERLLRVDGDQLATSALAGTRPRGRNPDEDAAFGRALCESKKEQAEHAAVVRELRLALEPHCETLEIPEAPTLLRLPDLQHLETRVSARLAKKSASRLLALAARLHPTPAVGGAPVEAALDWIRQYEGMDRGWYAGPVGFVDANGGGELSVGLRCALIHGGTARLFSGGGVVDGADPHAELLETRLKLRPLLSELVEV